MLFLVRLYQNPSELCAMDLAGCQLVQPDFSKMKKKELS